MNFIIRLIRRWFSTNSVPSLADKYKNWLDKGDSNQILREQRRLLSKLLCYAQLHSEYYACLLQQSDISPQNCMTVLKNLPLLTKKEIRENSFRIYSDEILPEWSFWQNTGGSTGEPLHFPCKSHGVSLELIHQYMLYVKMGWKCGECIVSIDGSRVAELDRKRNIYWAKGENFPYGEYSYSTLYMTESTIGYYVDSLEANSPSILRGYPSGFLRISHYMLQHNISFKFSPKGIYLTSEQYSDADRALISKVFAAPVYGQYGHTESSVFAITESNSMEYVCSPFYGVTEVLDNNGNEVQFGEIGEIVVTGFSNVGLPFIRYRTGDLAIYGGVKAGCTVLTSLFGRTADYVLDVNSEKVYLVGLIFGSHLRAFNHISDWQVEQNEAGIAILKIVKSVGYNDEIENELISLFSEKKIRIEILYLSELCRTQGGKRRFMLQNCM